MRVLNSDIHSFTLYLQFSWNHWLQHKHQSNTNLQQTSNCMQTTYYFTGTNSKHIYMYKHTIFACFIEHNNNPFHAVNTSEPSQEVRDTFTCFCSFHIWERETDPACTAHSYNLEQFGRGIRTDCICCVLCV